MGFDCAIILVQNIGNLPNREVVHKTQKKDFSFPAGERLGKFVQTVNKFLSYQDGCRIGGVLNIRNRLFSF